MNAFDNGGLASIRFRHHHVFDSAFARRQGSGKRAAHRAHASIERQFTEKHILVENFTEERPLATEQPERDRKIERRAFLAHVGGRQIYRDGKVSRKIEAAIFQRGLGAFAALLHGDVRETDHIEIARLAGADVDLDFDQVGVNAINGGAECFKEHRERKAGLFRHLQDNLKGTSTPP